MLLLLLFFFIVDVVIVVFVVVAIIILPENCKILFVLLCSNGHCDKLVQKMKRSIIYVERT